MAQDARAGSPSDRVRHDSLRKACRHIDGNDREGAEPCLEDLFLDHVDVGTPNNALLCHIQAMALLQPVNDDREDTANIYLQEFDVPQIILYLQDARGVSQCAVNQYIANRYLGEKLRHLKEATLFDIGVGKGRQIAALIRETAKSRWDLHVMHVVGLDPEPANVSDSGELMAQLNQELRLEIQYHPMCCLLEDFTENDFAFVKGLSDGLLISTLSHSTA